jgi:hypothetical protein
MKQFLRRPTLFVLALLSMAGVALAVVAPASADNGCGIG